jgi:hypothetical protein
MDYGIEHSTKLNAEAIKKKDSLLKSYNLTHEGKSYQIIFDNFGSFSTPDEYIGTGDVKIIVDEVTVFHTQFWDNPSSQWSDGGYSIRCDTEYPDAVKSIRSGDWIKDIPEIVSMEKSARKRSECNRKQISDQEKSDQIEQNFD